MIEKTLKIKNGLFFMTFFFIVFQNSNKHLSRIIEDKLRRRVYDCMICMGNISPYAPTWYVAFASVDLLFRYMKYQP